MARMPDYSVTFEVHNGKKIAVMIDLDKGNVSLTNGMEEAVAEVKKMTPDVNYFLYRDSGGMWDGWDDQIKDFIIISETDKERAIEELLEYHEA